MLYRFFLFVSIAAGLAIGSLLVQRFVKVKPTSSVEMYGNSIPQTQFDLSIGNSEDRLKLVGWRSGKFSAFWMSESTASLQIPAEAVTSQRMSLLFDGLIEVKGKEANLSEPVAKIRIFANRVELGVWTIWGDQSFATQRFLVPASIPKKDGPLELTFERVEDVERKPWRMSFGLKKLRIEDMSLMRNFRSHLDGCQGSIISGWSIVDDVPIPVDVLIDGVTQPVTQVAVYRPDLKSAGLPPDAGFHLTLPNPPTPGTEVSVVYRGFPDREIKKSPCKL